MAVFVKSKRDGDFAVVAPHKWGELFAAVAERTVMLPNGHSLQISSKRPAGVPWTLRAGDNLNVPPTTQPQVAQQAAEGRSFGSGRPHKRAKTQRDSQVPAAAAVTTRPKKAAALKSTPCKGPKKR